MITELSKSLSIDIFEKGGASLFLKFYSLFESGASCGSNILVPIYVKFLIFWLLDLNLLVMSPGWAILVG